MELDWDEAKRVRILCERGLDFADARLFFDGRPAVLAPSTRDGEERCCSTAVIGGEFVSLVWMRRDDTIRVIMMEGRMQRKKSNIVSYTFEELERMPARTDWAKVAATTQAEVEAQIAEDPDDWIADAGGVLIRGIPSRPTKERVNIRLDRDILDFFRAGGPGYQSRINEVLKVFERRAPRPAARRKRAGGR
jgi:uncharacterized protein